MGDEINPADTHPAHHHCRLCGKYLDTLPWVLLNRVGYGTGRCRGMTEFRNEAGVYTWKVGADLDAEDEIVSGPVLCFPDCLRVFLEGRMIEADIAQGHTDG